jgi:F0F1-type ATP synthase membrane subunit c/vacuolar-type H+-ATPase subunit K
MGLYIFVIAAAIAVIGILLIFKRQVEQIKEDPSRVGVAQQNFFIGTAIIEIVPILLLIYGIVNLETVPVEEIYVPVVIVALLMVFSVFFILLQRAVDVDEESKQPVTTFSFVAIAMANAIPLIAIVFLFMAGQG